MLIKLKEKWTKFLKSTKERFLKNNMSSFTSHFINRNNSEDGIPDKWTSHMPMLIHIFNNFWNSSTIKISPSPLPKSLYTTKSLFLDQTEKKIPSMWAINAGASRPDGRFSTYRWCLFWTWIFIVIAAANLSEVHYKSKCYKFYK